MPLLEILWPQLPAINDSGKRFTHSRKSNQGLNSTLVVATSRCLLKFYQRKVLYAEVGFGHHSQILLQLYGLHGNAPIRAPTTHSFSIMSMQCRAVNLIPIMLP